MVSMIMIEFNCTVGYSVDICWSRNIYSITLSASPLTFSYAILMMSGSKPSSMFYFITSSNDFFAISQEILGSNSKIF